MYASFITITLHTCLPDTGLLLYHPVLAPERLCCLLHCLPLNEPVLRALLLRGRHSALQVAADLVLTTSFVALGVGSDLFNNCRACGRTIRVNSGAVGFPCLSALNAGSRPDEPRPLAFRTGERLLEAALGLVRPCHMLC